MAKLDLVNAVRETTDRFLANRHEIWSRLQARVADELAPLLADLVRQELIQHLGEPTPDVRLERMKKAAAQVQAWWSDVKAPNNGWMDSEESILHELSAAAECLPAEMPPQLLLDAEARDRYVQLSDAARVALTTLEGLQRNPLILDAELVYPVQKLRAALGEVGHD